MRIPYIINKDVKNVYTPSKETLELISEIERKIRSEDFEWDEDLVPSLVTFCVRAIAKNFSIHPLLQLPFCADRDHLLQILPTDLPLELVVPLIQDEFYWKRRYVGKYNLVMRKRSNFVSWKSLFLERHMQDLIESAQPQYADEDNMEDITNLLSPYIHTLEITQLQAWQPPLTWSKEDIPEVYPIDHINFEPILKRLENVKELDIIYGVKEVSEVFEFRLFQISKDDCRNLGRGVLLLKNITVLRLHRSQLGDEQIQALMQGLVKNKTLEELDLSHCVVGDHGALCIAKVLSVHPTLSKLTLCDNQIKTQGAEGIAFALLQENSCPLTHLNLRLNPLGHDGCHGIMKALVRSDKIVELNLAACGFETDTAILFGLTIKMNSSLRVVDVSNNWFSVEGGEAILYSLDGNKTLEWLDLRETDIPHEILSKINKLLERTRQKSEMSDEYSLTNRSDETLDEGTGVTVSGVMQMTDDQGSTHTELTVI